MGTKQVIRLFDSQWVNVVNHDRGYEGYTVEDAVAKAVKLTEEYLAKNFKDGVWPTVEDVPNAALRGAEPASSAERPLEGTVMRKEEEC